MLTSLELSFKNRSGKWKGTPNSVDKTHPRATSSESESFSDVGPKEN